jgi:REP element-mobilizing transposase RayT
MVRGYHVILSVYGFWLPNDPRGSWSEFVRSWELLRFGSATKVDTRASVAGREHDRDMRRAAKTKLRYPPVQLSGVQARAVGRGFAESVSKTKATIWACSILPEHMHLVIARHDYVVEQVVNLMKGRATKALIRENIHPFAAYPTRTDRMPKVFARGHWKVYLDSDADIRRAIEYVERNPVKERKPRQTWNFDP